MLYFFIFTLSFAQTNQTSESLNELLDGIKNETVSEESVGAPVYQKSQIFQYIKSNQGSVKSSYHKQGVFFDVDPD